MWFGNCSCFTLNILLCSKKATNYACLPILRLTINEGHVDRNIGAFHIKWRSRHGSNVEIGHGLYHLRFHLHVRGRLQKERNRRSDHSQKVFFFISTKLMDIHITSKSVCTLYIQVWMKKWEGNGGTGSVLQGHNEWWKWTPGSSSEQPVREIGWNCAALLISKTGTQ